MNKTLYPAALALLLPAAPALAAPREDAACLVGKLSTADIETIVNESVVGGSSEAVARLTGPLHACAGGEIWPPRRRAEAAAFAIGAMDRTTLGGRLRAAGVDSAALDRWFARQSDEFRTTAFMGMSEEAMQAAFATLVGQEVSASALEREARTIGGYVAALVIIERIERGLGME